MSLPLPELSTPRLLLRLPRLEDAAEIVEFYLRNRAFFERTNPARSPESYATDYWQRHVPRLHADFREDRACNLLAFAHGAPQRVIASVNLFAFIRGNFHAAILGYCLDEAHTGRGLASEAVNAVVSYGFEGLHLHRIMANYWVENHASGRLLERLGFLREGYAREYLCIGGRWVDHYNTAKINPAWKPPPSSST